MNPKTILLLGQARRDEAVAAATLTPGQLAKLDSNGKLIAHDVAAGAAEALFISEDALQGRTIDSNQSAGEQTPFIIAGKGDVVYTFLAGGESVTPADYLTSDGAGSLKKATSTNTRLAVPLETVDNSDTGATKTRIRARII